MPYALLNVTYHVAGIQRGAVTASVAVYRGAPLEQPRPGMKTVGGVGIRNAILKLLVVLKVLEEAGVLRPVCICPVRVCVGPVGPVCPSGRGGVVVVVRGAAKGGGDRVVPHRPRSQGVLRWVKVGVELGVFWERMEGE